MGMLGWECWWGGLVGGGRNHEVKSRDETDDIYSQEVPLLWGFHADSHELVFGFTIFPRQWLTKPVPWSMCVHLEFRDCDIGLICPPFSGSPAAPALIRERLRWRVAVADSSLIFQVLEISPKRVGPWGGFQRCDATYWWHASRLVPEGCVCTTQRTRWSSWGRRETHKQCRMPA